MTVKLTISYDGSAYCGWQVQPNGNTVQHELQSAIEKLVGAPVKLFGSGRTDAGVHAVGQVASFSVDECSIPPENFYKALNVLLPQDIRVTASERVDDEFNALKHAKRKTYSYNFYFGQAENPLRDRFALFLKEKPDLALMQQGAKVMVGEHDFKCFNASGGGAKTTTRTIYAIDFISTDDGFKVLVTGNGFLYNMVRTLSGTLLEIGYRKKPISDLEKALSTGDRAYCGKTLPAKGLILESVEY